MNLLDTTQDISTQLFSVLSQKPLPIMDPLQILPIIDFLDFISNLGWQEHSSDWDLAAIITLKNNTKLEATPGFGDCLQITNADKEPLELTPSDLYSEQNPSTLYLFLEAGDTIEEIFIPITEIAAIEYYC